MSEHRTTTSPAPESAAGSRPRLAGSRRGPAAPGSRRRASDTLGYLPPVREPRFHAKAFRRLLELLIVAGWFAGLAAALTAVVAVDAIDVPFTVARYGAALLTMVFTVTLVRRCGGSLLVWTPLVAAGIAATAYFELNWMFAALSILTAATSAVLAVMITRPAATTRKVVAEFTLALVVASSGAVAVAAWNADVYYRRYYLIVLAAAILLTLGVVWSLGAGLHGLGRRGFLMIVGGAVLLALILAYGAAVRTYGSQSVVDGLDSSIQWMHDMIGGVPRPAEVLVGFPALVWGISTRADRRQGWWMCAFGVVGMAVVTTSLASPNADPSYIALSTLYSAVLGLLLGLLVRRLDPGASSDGRAVGGRRALREEPAPTLRPEPGRTSPLK